MTGDTLLSLLYMLLEFPAAFGQTWSVSRVLHLSRSIQGVLHTMRQATVCQLDAQNMALEINRKQVWLNGLITILHTQPRQEAWF